MNSSTFSVDAIADSVRPFAKPFYDAALFQFGHTLLIYIVSIYLMYLSLSVHYAVTLCLSLVASTAYLRLFMIGHDCAHRSYLPKRWENEVVGNFIGVLTNTPLRYWASQHITHHRTIGNLDRRGAGDVTTLTVEEFENSSWLERVWYRIYRNPWMLMFVFAPIHFVVMQRWPLEQKKPSREVWISVMGTNIGIALYYGVLIWLMGFQAFLLVFAPVVILSAVAAVWLFYVQHQFEDAYFEREEAWNPKEAALTGSSFYNLPKFGHWISGNIGFHHIHHLNPRVPNYRLAECHQALPSLQGIKQITFLEGFATAHLALWDEAAKELVSFAESRRRRASAQG